MDLDARSEEWRAIGTRDMLRRSGRRLFRVLPAAPRCEVCSSPFEGVGGRIAAIGASGPSAESNAVVARLPEIRASRTLDLRERAETVGVRVPSA